MALKKHSLVIAGHKTSITLEDEFWQALNDAAKEDKLSLAALVTRIDKSRTDKTNLSSALRLFVLSRLHGRA